MIERISPTNDLAFKKVFASEKDKDVLAGLVNDSYGYHLTAAEIELRNPYSIEAYRESFRDNSGADEASGAKKPKLRQTIRDVTAVLKPQNADFTAELQIRPECYFLPRSVYYPCDRFCDGYNQDPKPNAAGIIDRYSSLRPVLSLNITRFNLFPDDDEAWRIFELYDVRHQRHFPQNYLRIGYFELTKKNFDNDNQRYWRDYFLGGEVADAAPEYIHRAARLIEVANFTEEERKMVTAEEKAIATYDADMYYAYAEGEAKGEAKGEARGKAEREAELILRMLANGAAPEHIAKLTGIPLSRIEQVIIN
ncbi:MAG: Rpn family recombination-promoting nuclease/putative transposase [Planctomycetota bacterium]|jgi:predicted transposase/invertase (TIGR01784 family)|nr:Rpn family recombination-promoting nuclease/putative transposase [Planctomycetota bacterium]